MTKPELAEIMTTLGAAYPHAFPKTREEQEVTLMVWYADLGHLPHDLMVKAAAHMRKRCEFPSIAEMWKSVLVIAGAPTRAKIRNEIGQRLKGVAVSRSLVEVHPITNMIWASADGYAGIHGLDAISFDFMFNREYAEARQRWFDQVSKPENVEVLLTGTEREQITK